MPVGRSLFRLFSIRSRFLFSWPVSEKAKSIYNKLRTLAFVLLHLLFSQTVLALIFLNLLLTYSSILYFNYETLFLNLSKRGYISYPFILQNPVFLIHLFFEKMSALICLPSPSPNCPIPNFFYKNFLNDRLISKKNIQFPAQGRKNVPPESWAVTPCKISINSIFTNKYTSLHLDNFCILIL